jgi:deglycase
MGTGNLSGRNILLVIPKNQFAEDELFATRDYLEAEGARVVALSPKGQEAVGMNKTRFQPQGMLIDWNKQAGIHSKYDAVLLVGGKGAAKSLWPDPILPQILTDHYRAGRVVGALGFSVAVLARASFLNEKPASGPEDAVFLQELEDGGGYHSEDPVTCHDRIITASGGEAAQEFASTVTRVLMEDVDDA